MEQNGSLAWVYASIMQDQQTGSMISQLKIPLRGRLSTTNGKTAHPKVDVSIALKANDAAAVPDLIKDITSLGEHYSDDYDQTRINLAMKARTLWKSLETPRETMIRHLWAEPSVMCALTAGFDKGLWTYLADNEGPFTAADAAKAVEVDEALLFHEYAYLKKWKDPTDLNFFEHLHNNPPYGQQFHHHMGGYRQGRPSWMDAGFFPVQEKLIKGFEEAEDAALLVDVGGSFGHDLAEFRAKFPDAPGRLVLQDLPVVIEKIHELDDNIEREAYDFFTEQPIKGARAYYMHSVLHDWNDETCLKILCTVMEAMEPGYSKLLINENVIPETGAQWEATALDIMMLTLLASRERTRDNWEMLLRKAGLKIVQVWTVANGVESLIECELS
ncbi:S-adenosyl-L-methionine-dependent methyltransferase [Dactylonectria estremocensis]|uniref:S-adenosyl-L-methionine-dependent methyltransferase n=1 Tax=Dactylonectria estremocensis TaxID=1079267 RepID=A0A9P9DNK5_9HYPO|nr:S-adenosyl-L-methionine-dependent methyltransferase [Dactylonectria estremocensis]